MQRKNVWSGAAGPREALGLGPNLGCGLLPTAGPHTGVYSRKVQAHNRLGSLNSMTFQRSEGTGSQQINQEDRISDRDKRNTNIRLERKCSKMGSVVGRRPGNMTPLHPVKRIKGPSGPLSERRSNVQPC